MKVIFGCSKQQVRQIQSLLKLERKVYLFCKSKNEMEIFMDCNVYFKNITVEVNTDDTAFFEVDSDIISSVIHEQGVVSLTITGEEIVSEFALSLDNLKSGIINYASKGRVKLLSKNIVKDSLSLIELSKQNNMSSDLFSGESLKDIVSAGATSQQGITFNKGIIFTISDDILIYGKIRENLATFGLMPKALVEIDKFKTLGATTIFFGNYLLLRRENFTLGVKCATAADTSILKEIDETDVGKALFKVKIDFENLLNMITNIDTDKEKHVTTAPELYLNFKDCTATVTIGDKKIFKTPIKCIEDNSEKNNLKIKLKDFIGMSKFINTKKTNALIAIYNYNSNFKFESGLHAIIRSEIIEEKTGRVKAEPSKV